MPKATTDPGRKLTVEFSSVGVISDCNKSSFKWISGSKNQIAKNFFLKRGIRNSEYRQLFSRRLAFKKI